MSGVRVRAAAVSVLIHALLGYLLLAGFGFAPGVTSVARTLALITLRPPPPPHEILRPHPKRSTRRSGAASAPNVRSRATPIVVPPKPVPTKVPQVVATLTKSDQTDRTTGNAPIAGPGTGSGGRGTGTGNGDAGDGSGDGGEIPPRQVKGRIKNSDYPASAGESGASGTVSVRYTVEIDGRADHCIITRSSGNADLDATTCRLIEARFRFNPSRDARGRAVTSTIVEDHEWIEQHD